MNDEKNNAMCLTITSVGQLSAIQHIYAGILAKYEDGSEERTILMNEIKHVDDVTAKLVRLYNEKYKES